MIINLEQLEEKLIEVKTPIEATCKLCKTLLYDDQFLSCPIVGGEQIGYFYCEDCSDKEDQEISFEKRYLVKSITVELEEINL